MCSSDLNRRPARLFATLDAEFKDTVKWEAQVPFVVALACLEIADYDPLAALALSLEWGNDTDSYAQMTGALIGAMHGPDIFPTKARAAVETRLRADYEQDLSELARFMAQLAERSHKQRIIAFD